MEKTKKYADKNISIKQPTKDAFDKEKKGKSADEFIFELLKLHREYKPSDFKNLESKCKALEEENTKLKNERLNQPQPAPAVIAPQTEVSKETSEITEPPTSVEPVKVGGQQCYYHRVSHKKGFIDCMRKYAKTEEIDRFTQQVCDYCWTQDPYKKYPIPNSQVTDEQITSDVPLGMPQDPEKQKAMQELKEEATKPLPLPPCHYVGEGYIDKKRNVQVVFCREPKKIPKGKGYAEFPFSICYSCWEGKDWAKRKREREQENNIEQEQKAEPKTIADFPPCENITSRQTRSKDDPLTEFPIGTELVYCRDKGEWKTSEQCLKCVEDETHALIPTDMNTAETEGTEE